MALTAFLIAILTSWDLTLVILAGLPITLLVLRALAIQLQPILRSLASENGIPAARITTAIGAIETVKSFQAEGFEHSQYVRCLERAAELNQRQTSICALQNGFVRFASMAIFAQGFWYGSRLVARGAKSSGEIITVFWACITLSYALQRLLPLLVHIEKGRIAADALIDVNSAVQDSIESNRHLTVQDLTSPIAILKFTSVRASDPQESFLTLIGFLQLPLAAESASIRRYQHYSTSWQDDLHSRKERLWQEYAC